MKGFDRISSVFLMILSAVICIASYRLRLGSPSAPGPGFYPMVAGGVMGLLSFITLARTVKMGDATASFWRKTPDKKAVVISTFFLILYALLLEPLGFLVTTALFFFCVVRFISRKNWTVTVVYTGLVSASAYILFDILLKASLPTGILGRLF